jgi:hypothetical protein
MTYMVDGKTADEGSTGGSIEISVGDNVEGDGFETIYPTLKKVCGRLMLKTHFQKITCELDPGHPPPCEGKGIRR